LFAAMHESACVQVFGRRLSEREDGLIMPASEKPAHNRKSPSFDHLVGAGEKGFRDGQPIAFAVLRLMTSSNLVGCLTGSGADCIGDSKAG